MLKRFINDTIKYYKYSIFSARAQLKAEVAGSYLNWIWWVLEPVCLMLIYTFVFGYVFNASEKYFTIFVYIGLTMWQFFERTVKQSIRLVKNNKSIVTKVYMPKFILILTKIWINGFKMMISFGIVFVLMVIYRVPITWNILYIVPIIVMLLVFTFGVTAFLMHFGVYVADLSNVMNIVLKFMFYLTGIFYNVESKIPIYGGIFCRLNPIAFVISATRKILIYETSMELVTFIVWLLVSLLIAVLGIRKIYKNENSYVKMI